MRYLTICSGIGAPEYAWRDLPWTCIGQSEIAPFPSTVLAQRFPTVKNYGDFTKWRDWPTAMIAQADLVVGGTPCQSFSLAGQRKGVADPRGRLTFEFLKFVDHYRFPFVIWENVPGILSSDGGKIFASVIDLLVESGYMVDAEILDAQNFGVPQRRRRIFLICELFEHGRRKKSPFFAATVVNCLTSTLQCILAAHRDQLNIAGGGSIITQLNAGVGLQKKMKLLGMPICKQRESHITQAILLNLLKDLDDALAKLALKPKNLDSTSDQLRPEPRITETTFYHSQDQSTHTSTSASWLKVLGVAYDVANTSTTLTAIHQITTLEIYTCALELLNIEKSIIASTHYLENFCDEKSSGLIALKEFIDYARSATNDLFTGFASGCDWIGFLQQAEPIRDALERHFRNKPCADALLPLGPSVRRNPRPGRAPQTPVAALTANGVGTCGADDNQAQAGHLIEHIPPLAHALRASHDASEDGTGRGTPLVSTFRMQAMGEYEPDDCASTLKERDYKCATDLIVSEPLAFNARQDPTHGPLADALGTRDTGHGILLPQGVTIHGSDGMVSTASYADLACCLRSRTPGGVENSSTTAVHERSGVRRLTPVECERLQGFEDNWTAVQYRGKDACDGPRYAAIGNSMAVPVLTWIGRRIELINECG